ncbi:unnamed protein product [Agarophyton chilense]
MDITCSMDSEESALVFCFYSELPCDGRWLKWESEASFVLWGNDGDSSCENGVDSGRDRRFSKLHAWNNEAWLSLPEHTNSRYMFDARSRIILELDILMDVALNADEDAETELYMIFRRA